jgi:carboxypeptidase Taq
MSFSEYRKLYAQLQTYRDIQSVLQWDSEVKMPRSGREARSHQIGEMSRLSHEMFTGTKFRTAIQKAWDEIQTELIRTKDSEQAMGLQKKAKEIQILKERQEKTAKLPTSFVQNLAQKTSVAQGVWEEAKKNSNFQQYETVLEELVQLARQQADYYGYKKEAYDALIDDYEKSATAEFLAGMFSELKKELIPIVEKGKSYPNPFQHITTNMGKGIIPQERQEAFCRRLPEALGLKSQESRLDTSSHPFSTSLGPKDKRITTRYDGSDPLSAVFGVMHEVGHSLYEAGLSEIPEAPHPIAEYLSLGIHESQSRLWENQVGRSSEFWEYYYPIALQDWGLNEKELPFADLFHYIRSVEKTKIRVEADQVTYNLHIILRFEIERDLIAGRVNVSDLPEIWNEKMKESLGIRVENDSEGLLQDVHWCMAAFGYFPTYTLGNIYSAQLYNSFLKAHPEFPGQLAQTGNTSVLLNWLRQNVHHRGKEWEVEQLITNITGSSSNIQYLIQHLNNTVI